MRTPQHRMSFAILVLPALLVAASVGAESFPHGRVSYEEGGALVKGIDDDQWSFATLNTLVLAGDTLWADDGAMLELEMRGGTFLRMADGSKMEIEKLPPKAILNAWIGSFYVERLDGSKGSAVVTTRACAVHVEENSVVRIDVLGDGATTVSVRNGSAKVSVEHGPSVLVREGRRTFIDPGYLPSTPTPFDRTAEDDFDAWNRNRMLALRTAGTKTVRYINDTPIGYADLDSYGEWVTIDNRACWRPTVVVDYVPYRTGHWSYVPACGYTWVGRYPFSYVTSHYGRWTYHSGYGWVWAYQDAWAPAWVATVQYGPNFVWCPLDWNDSPYYSVEAYFTIGNVHFGLGASSYCTVSDLSYGPCAVYACTPPIVANVPTTQISVWNIYAGSRNGRGRVPRLPVPVRDYAPRRVIRGPEIHGPNGLTATGRIVSLETTSPAVRSTANVSRRSMRTPLEASSRQARPRGVRVSGDATLNAALQARTPTRGSVRNPASPTNRSAPLATTAPAQGGSHRTVRTPSAPTNAAAPTSRASSSTRTTSRATTRESSRSTTVRSPAITVPTPPRPSLRTPTPTPSSRATSSSRTTPSRVTVMRNPSSPSRTTTTQQRSSTPSRTTSRPSVSSSSSSSPSRSVSRPSVSSSSSSSPSRSVSRPSVTSSSSSSPSRSVSRSSSSSSSSPSRSVSQPSSSRSSSSSQRSMSPSSSGSRVRSR